MPSALHLVQIVFKHRRQRWHGKLPQASHNASGFVASVAVNCGAAACHCSIMSKGIERKGLSKLSPKWLRKVLLFNIYCPNLFL